MYGYGNTLLAKVVSFPLAAGHNILGITDALLAAMPQEEKTEGRPFKRTFLELPQREDGDYHNEDQIEEDAADSAAGGEDAGGGEDAEEGGAGGAAKPTVKGTLTGKKIGEVALPSSIPNIKINTPNSKILVTNFNEKILTIAPEPNEIKLKHAVVVLKCPFHS